MFYVNNVIQKIKSQNKFKKIDIKNHMCYD